MINTNTVAQAAPKTETASQLELKGLLNRHLHETSKISYEEIDGVRTETRTVVVSPKLAEALLLRNTNNRPINKTNVNKITKAMLNGEWKFDGTPIIFDWNAVLSNGAHRLTSVVKSGKTITFKIGTGYDPAIFATMDTGKSRTGSDVLAVAGVDNYKLYTSTANFLYKLLRGSIGEVGGNTGGSTLMSHPELLKFIDEKPRIKESIHFFLDNKKKQSTKILQSYMICGFHYMFSVKDKVDAEEFLTKLLTGNGLSERSPILAVRNRIINTNMDKSKHLTHAEIIKLVYTGWNKFRNGEYCKSIQIPEKLPVIK